MKHLTALVVTMAVGAIFACSDDDGDGNPANTAGRGGTAGAGGSAGTGGAGGTAGRAGSGGGGAGGTPPVVLPDPALPPNAPTLACPQVINGAIEASDDTQTGRYSRDGASSVCGVAKTYPDTAADPTGGHLYDVYRFANPSAAPACFTFTLTYGGAPPVVVDAGLDGGADAAVESPDAAADGGGVVVVPTELQKFLAAFNTFYPTDLSLEYLGDVGGTLTPPQTMGITVPAGETIDVVVYAVANAPAGVDSYTLSCSTP